MTQDYHDNRSNDGDLSLLNELLSFAKQECISITAKPSLGNTAEKTVDHTLDGNPAIYSESRVGGSQG